MKKVAEYFFRYFNYLFALVIAAMYANALIFPNMGVDASFYLRVTELIMEGAIPEHDLRILYPPLIFYMLLPVKIIVGKAIAYEIFLGYMFLIQFINAYLIYRISSKYSKSSFLRIFSGLLYLFLSIKLEGEYFFLEPFINLWGLLAVWIYLHKGSRGIQWLLLSGFLAFLAFLTKQYGLAYAVVVFTLILADNVNSLKKGLLMNLFFVSGILAGMILFILGFRWGYGVFYDFFAGGRLSMYGEKDIVLLVQGLLKYLAIAPYVLVLLLPPVISHLLKKEKQILGYIALLMLFSVQLYFQQYDHYYILMVPVLIIIGIMLVSVYSFRNQIFLVIVILCCLTVNEFYLGNRSKSLILSTKSGLAKEIDRAIAIKKIIPEESKIYIFSDVKLYYLCRFQPVLPEKYGYAYNNALSKKDLSTILSGADKLLVYEHQLNQNYHLLDGVLVIEIDSLLKDFHITDKIGEHLICRRKPLNDLNY